MTTKRGKRAAIYQRISLSTEESVSIDRQERTCREYLESRGYEVAVIGTDRDIRATKKKPMERAGWRDEIVPHLPSLDVVITWKLDRLIRSVRDFSDVTDQLAEHDVELGTVFGMLQLDTPEGKAFAQISAVFGEMEAGQIGARAKAAREQLMLDGRRAGGIRPWPFSTSPNPNGPGVVLRPIPERADAVRWVATWIMEGGSWHSACRELNDRGLVPDRAEFWHVSPLRRLMQNVAIAGGSTYHGETVRNQDGSIRIDPDQAILPVEEWLHLCRVIDGGRVVTRRSAEPSLLRGIIACDTCYRPMHYHQPTDSYRCTNQRCDRQVSIRRKVADEIYLERWVNLLGEATQEPPEAPLADPLMLATLTDQLEQIGREIDADPSDERALELFRIRRDLRQQIRDLRAEVESSSAIKVEAWNPSRGETWGARLSKASTVAEKNEVLRDMGAIVYVRPGPRGGRPKDLAERLDWRAW